jgi:hypothetical protein
MKMIEIRCENCGKKIYVWSDYLKEKMFCTLECMSSYKETPSLKSITLQ